jgi:hypothetical protein
MQRSAGTTARFASERLRDSELPFYRGVTPEGVKGAQRRLLTLCSKARP